MAATDVSAAYQKKMLKSASEFIEEELPKSPSNVN
jgi:hypothetical protein